MSDRQPPTAFDDCGTERAYWRHVKRHEQPDQPCKDAHADHVRAKRDAQPRPVPECGTVKAYARHIRHGEPIDAKCRAARTEANRIGREADRLTTAIFGA